MSSPRSPGAGAAAGPAVTAVSLLALLLAAQPVGAASTPATAQPVGAASTAASTPASTAASTPANPAAGTPVSPATSSAPSPVAGPAAGAIPPPVTIAVYGDSVVESATFPGFLRYGLVPQLRAALAKQPGFALGGEGFVPAYPLRWAFHGGVSPGNGPPPLTGWLVSGYGSNVPGFDGLSGYSAITRSRRASATTAIDAGRVGILFNRSPDSGAFAVTAGGRSFPISARHTGRAAPAEAWISVPPGARTITIHGPRSGVLTFDGVIVRGRPPAGRIGVEVENLGHSGHYLATDSHSRNVAAIEAQHFEISLFMASYKRELDAAAADPSASQQAYAGELRERVGLARRSAGVCVIAAPSPLPVPASITAGFDAIDQSVATSDGCTYTTALAKLWSPATAVRSGMTLIDGIHPAASGYRLIVRALVPLLATLVRQRARTDGLPTRG